MFQYFQKIDFTKLHTIKKRASLKIKGGINNKLKVEIKLNTKNYKPKRMQKKGSTKVRYDKQKATSKIIDEIQPYQQSHYIKRFKNFN